MDFVTISCQDCAFSSGAPYRETDDHETTGHVVNLTAGHRAAYPKHTLDYQREPLADAQARWTEESAARIEQARIDAEDLQRREAIRAERLAAESDDLMSRIQRAIR